MTKKIYLLSTCSTCQRLIKSMDVEGFELQDIKADLISAKQLEDLKALVGSYEELFSRRAMKYRAMGLHKKVLTESDYRQLILDEYTFLKRPVIVVGNQVFVGNSKKTVEAAKLLIAQS